MDLFEVLKHIDENNFSYFQSLPLDEKKEISPFLLLRWLSMTNNKDKMLRLNASANKNLFKLAQYPEIVFSLLCSSGNGKKEFYEWRGQKKIKAERPLTAKLLKAYYNLSNQVAIEDSMLMNFESISFIAEELGEWDLIETLEKEYV